jgi:hypothetical protein
MIPLMIPPPDDSSWMKQAVVATVLGKNSIICSIFKIFIEHFVNQQSFNHLVCR